MSHLAQPHNLAVAGAPPPPPQSFDPSEAAATFYDQERKRRSSRDENVLEGTKRRRSRSPGFHPRDDRYYGRRPAAGRYNMARESLDDPYNLEHLVSFSYYCDWYREVNPQHTLDVEALRAKYEVYRDDLHARLAQDFVKEKMKDQWFKEKYDPTISKKTQATVSEFRRHNYRHFMEHLTAGIFDQWTLDGGPKKKENGEPLLLQAQKTQVITIREAGHANEPGALVEEVELVAAGGVGWENRDENAYRKTILLKTISPTVSRFQLEEVVGKVPGFRFLSLSDPNPAKKFHRIGWIVLDEEADVDAALKLLENVTIHDEVFGDFTCHTGIHAAPRDPKKKMLYAVCSTIDSLRKDMALATLAVEKYEAVLGDGFHAIPAIQAKAEELRMKEDPDYDEDEEGAIHEEDEEAESGVDMAVLKKALDITIEYLRRVHSFCYYCVSDNDSVHELTRKCPAGHVRRPAPPPDYVPDSRALSWLKNWQDKISLFLEPESADLKKLGGKPVDKALETEIVAHIKREAEGRFRCRVDDCTKLFSAPEFVRKHISKRHLDWSERVKLQVTLLNNYVTDPCRVVSQKAEAVPPPNNPLPSISNPVLNNNLPHLPAPPLGLPTPFGTAPPMPFVAPPTWNPTAFAPFPPGSFPGMPSLPRPSPFYVQATAFPTPAPEVPPHSVPAATSMVGATPRPPPTAMLQAALVDPYVALGYPPQTTTGKAIIEAGGVPPVQHRMHPRSPSPRGRYDGYDGYRRPFPRYRSRSPLPRDPGYDRRSPPPAKDDPRYTRDPRAIRSYHDLDAPRDATPPLPY
ncbi:hypothetical protein SAICODRAFT_23505 [Saitoella complicata NRRL Y-17804]|uniref:uncharacterized protein n=1 Tax=Saitoella complicata (strain BCRC 22490 / CBS 7301 / JCM 7358 / NBRC 10748 / NRRL Y-17804) TaxID=698492 RepID=UPI0008673AC3|nr:uncharacterized protein SAICODRAFT_23505 [Saitoella complicata NRRL Y-17804]ODQ55469.1 hypothetical protein SAICODRAFT_23505 [Saitoella complicata NRRL Y-17804]